MGHNFGSILAGGKERESVLLVAQDGSEWFSLGKNSHEEHRRLFQSDKRDAYFAIARRRHWSKRSSSYCEWGGQIEWKEGKAECGRGRS